jgi:hypothetical protein
MNDEFSRLISCEPWKPTKGGKNHIPAEFLPIFRTREADVVNSHINCNDGALPNEAAWLRRWHVGPKLLTKIRSAGLVGENYP